MKRAAAALITTLAIHGSGWAAIAVPSRTAIDATIRAAATASRAIPGAPVGAARPDTARVRLGASPGAAMAFVAWPSGDDPHPAILVAHEAWGLNRQMRETARRLSREGYVVIVPDLYHGKVTSDANRALELSRSLDAAHAMADLHAAARWLRSQSRVESAKIAVLGLGMGGALSQSFALDTSRVAAAVTFYGSPETDRDRLASLNAPLQAHFGAADETIGMARVGELKAAMSALGKAAEIYVYPGAGAGFMNEGQPSYRPDAARQAWARVLAFLQKYLKG